MFTTISGRLPVTADQVALGATTMHQLGTHLGSLVRITLPRPRGGLGTAWYRVVGTTIFAPDFDYAGLGTGVVLTLPGLLGAECAQGPAQEACLLSGPQRGR